MSEYPKEFLDTLRLPPETYTLPDGSTVTTLGGWYVLGPWAMHRAYKRWVAERAEVADDE